MSQRKAEYKYSKKSPMENMRGLRFPKNHFESLTITHFYQKKNAAARNRNRKY